MNVKTFTIIFLLLVSLTVLSCINPAEEVATPLKLSALSIKASTIIKVGSNESLTPVFTPPDATDKSLTWSSTAESVATVDNMGKIQGIAVGTATIKALASDGAFESTCEVTVTADPADPTDPANPIDPINPADSTLIYEQSAGNSWHFVGQSNYVNTYRGSYWIGQSMNLSQAIFHLNYTGNISAINYQASVWLVDVANKLELKTCLGTSAPVAGSAITADSWISFDFPSPVSVVSGKTVILVSRVDIENDDVVNMLQINNNYDSRDADNQQMNVHYAGTLLAGRRPGDEDQPEPFAVDIRLYGNWTSTASAAEYPAPPMRLVRTDLSDTAVNLSWVNNNVSVSVASYKVYRYVPLDASLVFIQDASGTSTSLTGLSGAANQQFVVTAVGTNGNESFYSDRARATAGETVR